MALSNSYGFTVSRDEIITKALKDIGAIDITATPEAAEVTDAAFSLNLLLKQWMTDGIPLWTVQTVPVPLTIGVGAYTVGIGGQVNTGYHVPKILSAYLRNNSSQIDSPVTLLSRKDYQEMGNKTSSSAINLLYYDAQVPLGLLYVYGIPADTSNTLYITVQRPLMDVLTANDNFDLPQEFYQALRWSLAEDLCSSYSVPLQKWQFIQMKAKQYREEALTFYEENASIYFTVDTQGY